MCRWKDDPRDNGASWILLPTKESTRLLCLQPTTLSANDDDFDFEVLAKPTHVSARVWSPRFRGPVQDAPACLKFVYKLEATGAGLSLMRHSSL